MRYRIAYLGIGSTGSSLYCTRSVDFQNKLSLVNYTVTLHL